MNDVETNEPDEKGSRPCSIGGIQGKWMAAAGRGSVLPSKFAATEVILQQEGDKTG